MHLINSENSFIKMNRINFVQQPLKTRDSSSSSFFVLLRTRVVVHSSSLPEPQECVPAFGVPNVSFEVSPCLLLLHQISQRTDAWSIVLVFLAVVSSLHLGELSLPGGTLSTWGNSLFPGETLICLLLYAGFIETIGFTWLGQRNLCKQRLGKPPENRASHDQDSVW